MPSLSSQAGSVIATHAVRACLGVGFRRPGMNATPSPAATKSSTAAGSSASQATTGAIPACRK
jgi:hypothetical protein